MKGVFTLYEEKYFSLAEWIVVAGAAVGLFAVSVPNLHLLRLWSSLSCVLVLVFVAIPVGIAFHDGKRCCLCTVSLSVVINQLFPGPHLCCHPC